MAISTKPAAGTYSVNTSATWCPDLLWMCDEGSGTTLADVGKSAGTYNNDGTLSSGGTGSVTWGTTGAGEDCLVFAGSAANYGLARSANLSGVSTQFTAIVICQFTDNTSDKAVMSVADKDVGFQFASVEGRGDESVICYANVGTPQTATALSAGGYTNATTIMLAWRFKATAMQARKDDGDFAGTESMTGITFVGNYDSFALGARGDSDPSNAFDGKIIAFAVYADDYLSDTDVDTIYNSGDVWSSFGITTTTKYLKLLAHSSASTATSGVEVVAFSAPSGNDYITGTTRYGSANNKGFAAGTGGDSGYAVLKIPASDVGCGALAASTTVAVCARSSTYTTGVVSATIIEE
jgi:hypothetical protein